MLNLFNQDLDLGYRVKQYRQHNSTHKLSNTGAICIEGTVCRNRPLKGYIEVEPDVFETRLLSMMEEVVKDLSRMIDGCTIVYTYQNKFILTFYSETEVFRDNLNSLVVSRIVNLINKFYSNPMCTVTSFSIPKQETKNILNYHRGNWIARRNRILGNYYLDIPSKDKSYTHEEILSLVENKGFRLDLLDSSVVHGYSFSPLEV